MIETSESTLPVNRLEVVMRSNLLNTKRGWVGLLLLMVGLVFLAAHPVSAHQEAAAEPGEVSQPSADEQATPTPESTELPTPYRYYYEEYEREKNRPSLTMLILLLIVGVAAVVVLALVFLREVRSE
jgi:hypothetical protein